MPFLDAQFVEHSFYELRPIDGEGKRSLERTSGLMYFLAMCAVMKTRGLEILDFDPETAQGKTLRQDISLEFSRLVLLAPPQRHYLKQFLVLGKVDENGTPPEKRISSNFLTVPLKKAVLSKSVVYPGRPANAHLIAMGEEFTGISWGAKLHRDWRQNLPKFFAESKSKTPLTHLAIFLCRCCDCFANNEELLREELITCLKNRFPDDLADFWDTRMKSEKTFFKYEGRMFSSARPTYFAKNQFNSSAERLNDLLKMKHYALAEHALELEKALAERG